MVNENTKKVFEAVERAEREVRSAESQFDSDSRRVQRMADYTTIDIHNMSKAVEIIAAAKRATDDLYASYETIIRTLDMECKPYLELGISAAAIKAVAELMKEINEESSSLSNNATGSINGYSMGDLRTEHYMASIEARTIEKFWSASYSRTPEAAQEQKRKEEELAERRKRQAERAKLEAERRKKEEEEKKRQAELKAAEEKKIEQANAAAKLHMDKIADECEQKVEAYKKYLKEFIEKQRNAFKQQLDGKVNELKATVKELQEKEAQLGFFKMSEKKEIREEIKKLQARILKFQDPTVILNEINEMEEIANDAVEAYKSTLEEYMHQRFSDYKSTSKKKSKHTLMYTENPEVASKPIPMPVSAEEVF